MEQQQPRALALRRAAVILGGVRRLAAALNVPERQLDYWMREIGTPPDTVFLDVIAVIIERAGMRPRESMHRDPVAL